MHPKEAPSATPEQVLREILDVVTQLREGHFSAHLTDTLPGLGGEIAKALNGHLEFLKEYRDKHLRLMEDQAEIGLGLCTESQWQLACAGFGEIAKDRSLTDSLEPTGVVERGGNLCSDRRVLPAGDTAPS